MQALSPAVFVCHAGADRDMAAAIAAFLERGADVRIFLSEGEMQPGEDLAAKAREARMADVVVVLFSRNSMPPRWPRAQWEGPLVTEPAAEGVRIGFVRCDDCVPPRVLAPRFECEGLNLRGMRKLKRWVRDKAATYMPPDVMPPDAASPDAVQADTVPADTALANAALCPGYEPDLEVLGIALADRPGAETVASAALAFEFVHACREDFDEVFRVESGGRSMAALAGDLGEQLGMRLEDDLERNLERLRAFCSARRFLILLDGAPAPPPLIFGGRCSTLVSLEAGPTLSADPLRMVQREFGRGLLNPAADWNGLCRLARQGRRLAREKSRIAECFELMHHWHAAAEEVDDREALNESARELVWILEAWGREEEAARLEHRRVMDFEEQMRLF